MQSSWDGAPPPTASEAQLAEYLKRLCSDVTLLSNKDGFFAHWVHQISAYISEDFIGRFAKLTTDYERIQMAWRIKPLHSLKVTRFFKDKDEAASIKLRQDGNTAFQKKAVRQALLYYCQAVTRAPHTGSSLGLAYANRSAALSQMEEYRWCLRDARLALVHGYPADLRYKIFERAGHCYQKMAAPSKASSCYQSALEALKSSGLAGDKLKTWTKTLEQKLEECGKEMIQLGLEEDLVKDVLMDDPENTRVTDWKGVGEPAPAPRLYLGSNTSLPSASAAVTLTSSDDAGRCAVAGEQVPAGEVLVSEAPHAAVLAKDKTGAYCTHCCRRLLASVPCPTCCGVAYCSVYCCQQATTYHRWECPYLDFLHASGMSLNGYLALRIITQRPLQYFLELRPQIQASGTLQSTSNTDSDKLPKTSQKSASSKPLGSPLFVPSAKEPHDSSSYLSVYRLVGLQEQREPLDFLQRTLMAILLLKVLQRTGYFGFWDEEASPDADAPDQQLYVGALLLRNLQVLQFNAHEVSGMTFLSDPPAFKQSKSLYLGLAVYPTVAFFNHSCFPAVTRYFIGSRMVVCSIRSVGRGEPLAENYGPIFTHHTKEERRRKLLSRYWFTCACVACSANWGTYPELREPLRLRCPHCTAPVTDPPVPPSVGGSAPQSKKGAPVTSFRCRGCGKAMPFEQMTADMVQAQKLYVTGQDHMHAGRRESAILDMMRFVSTAQQHAMLPLKDVHLAMQALRLLVAARGTCAMVLPQGKA